MLSLFRESRHAGRSTISILAVIVGLTLVGACVYKYTGPIITDHVVEVERSTSFVMDRSFEDVRKAISRGRFQDEILKINNATLIQKEWSNKNISVHRPLSPDIYWSFDGQMTAKIQIGEPPALMEMIHKVHVSTEAVKIEATLKSPLDIGITDLKQNISILPDGEGKTKVDVNVYIKLEKTMPSWMTFLADKKINAAADESVQKFEQVIRTMPSDRLTKPPKKKKKTPNLPS